MANKYFISARGMARSKQAEAINNAYRKRRGWGRHPVQSYFCICGPNHGAIYNTDTSVDIGEITMFKDKGNRR